MARVIHWCGSETLQGSRSRAWKLWPGRKTNTSPWATGFFCVAPESLPRKRKDILQVRILNWRLTARKMRRKKRRRHDSRLRKRTTGNRQGERGREFYRLRLSPRGRLFYFVQ